MYYLMIPLLLIAQFIQAADKLEITPTKIWSQTQQTHQIKVTGGLPPFSWQTISGTVEEAEEDHVFIYTAPKRYMQDTIRFRDRSAHEVEIVVEVLRPLNITPQKRNIPINSETYLTVIGGSGEWQVEAADILTITQEGNKIKIKANEEVTIQDVQVQDNLTKEQVVAKINIYQPLEAEVE